MRLKPIKQIHYEDDFDAYNKYSVNDYYDHYANDEDGDYKYNDNDNAADRDYYIINKRNQNRNTRIRLKASLKKYKNLVKESKTKSGYNSKRKKGIIDYMNNK